MDCDLRRLFIVAPIVNAFFVLASAVLSSDLEIKCPQNETRSNATHVLPGSFCHQYYVCRDSAIEFRSCPLGTHYDSTSKACRVGGSCYDVVCTGRVDGLYADSTEICSRWYECRGGSLIKLQSCSSGTLYDESLKACVSPSTISCPHPKNTAGLSRKTSNPCEGRSNGTYSIENSSTYVKCFDQIEIDTQFCPQNLKFDGRKCSEVRHIEEFCHLKSDGYHVVEGTDCTEYILCRERHIVSRHKCGGGTAYDGKRCLPPHIFVCPRRNKCQGHPDGNYPDIDTNCASYFQCRREKIVDQMFCQSGFIWNGETCALQGEVQCLRTSMSVDCFGKIGYIGDADSECTRYHYCNNGVKLSFACPQHSMFDGAKCVEIGMFKCKELNPHLCEDVGYYSDSESNCRSYHFCANGSRITYLCPPKELFNGVKCVPAEQHVCPRINTECSNRPDGYQRTSKSFQDYAYCLNGDKVLSLRCGKDEVYDGEKCSKQQQFSSVCHNVRFGYLTDQNCKSYYFCVEGELVKSGNCRNEEVFDGNSCQHYREARCMRGSIHSCVGVPDGFYQDFASGCRKYFYCVNGRKTLLSCPIGQVHNGDKCVQNHLFNCPSAAVQLYAQPNSQVVQ